MGLLSRRSFSHSSKASTLLVITVFLSAVPNVVPFSCPQHEHALNSNRCCAECPPGGGVLSPCTPENNTICHNCTEGETYSDRWSYLDTCRTCTSCSAHSHVIRPCNVTHDTVCACDLGYHMDHVVGRCMPCDTCRPGTGTRRECNATHNTVCSPCPAGTFSDSWSRHACAVCTYCREHQIMLQMCTAQQDTVCVDIPESARYRTTPRPRPTGSHQEGGDINIHKSNSSNIIPVYCAILGLLVLSLIIYVIVSQMRQQKLKAARAAVTNTDHEGALIYHQRAPLTGSKIPASDSGVSLNNENNNLPPLRRKVIENQIQSHLPDRGGWRSLGVQLGYSPSELEGVVLECTRTGDSPSRCLLSDWSRLPRATVGALARAARGCGREDLALALLLPDPGRHPGSPSPSAVHMI